MKVKRLGITEILGRIYLFFANKIKSSESSSKQATQLIVELISSLRHIIVKIKYCELEDEDRLGDVKASTLYMRPSINYVVSKSAIFDPLPPLSRLFTK